MDVAQLKKLTAANGSRSTRSISIVVNRHGRKGLYRRRCCLGGRVAGKIASGETRKRSSFWEKQGPKKAYSSSEWAK